MDICGLSLVRAVRDGFGLLLALVMYTLPSIHSVKFIDIVVVLCFLGNVELQACVVFRLCNCISTTFPSFIDMCYVVL